MLHDFTVLLSEMLFWLTGGELLINSLWVFVYLAGSAIVMLLMVVYLTRYVNAYIVLIMLLISLSFIVINPPLHQMNMITECLPWETINITSTSPDVTKEVQIRKCRYKNNYYDNDYGEWKISFK